MKELDNKFYRKTLRPDRQRSYKMITKYILRVVQPDLKSVVDFGCGAGWFLYYFKKFGIDDIVGIEPNKEILEVLDKSVRGNIKFLDLSKGVDLHRRFDAAMNIEVGEHMDKKYADILVENITRHTNLLIFSAATPGQGGYGHINEQKFEYWETKLEKCDFYCDKESTSNFRNRLKRKKVKKWYIKNISVFRRK